MQRNVTEATCSVLTARARLQCVVYSVYDAISRSSSKGATRHELERALIFLRLRLSLRERFFFHFSLILLGGEYMRSCTSGMAYLLIDQSG